MEIWGMNIWTLWVIFMALGIILSISCGQLYSISEKTQKDKMSNSEPLFGLGFSFAAAPVIFLGIYGLVHFVGGISQAIYYEKLMGLMVFSVFFLGISLFCSVIGTIMYYQEKPLDTLKELERRQKEEMEKIKTS